MNSTATCSTWRRMGSVRLYFAHDPPCDENKQPCHTRSVATWVNKDCAFHHTPGWSCQVCYCCIIKNSWKRQHHHRHMEHNDTKSCRETLGTNTQNGQVQMEHPWTVKSDRRTLAKQQQRKDKRFSSVEKRINTSMALDFMFTGHREHCHGVSPSLQQAHHHPPEGSPFQHHNSLSVRPNVRL